MAQIILSQAGAAIGSALLPQGIGLLGRTISGAAIGRAAGTLIGRQIDSHFAGPSEGPRLKALHVTDAAEGTGIPSVYGRMRTGGHVIWASRLRERRKTRTVGGKGGPRVNDYTYTVSLAVALGEGPLLRVQRAWANEEAFDLSGILYRFYPGAEDQLPDPLIEMIEGAAPAFRGTAYLVFEDLPLDGFGNRIPQFSFEVVRDPGGSIEPGLGETVTGVNIIPASGEFVYATSIVREQLSPGRERPLNVNTGEARADVLVSLDQLQADLPRVSAVALTVGWFGSSIDAGACEIRPGVELRERSTRPYAWAVAGVGRDTAYLVSRDEGGRPNYGGTPSDACVIEMIRELTARGIAVTVSPFLFMDAPGFPWRGRIGVAADGSASARDDTETFVNREWGYRRFILHCAQLAADAGGVEAFLVGSEMRGMTRVRDAAGAFPFVDALRALATDVKAMLPGTNVSYAADWSEYGAYVPGDGSHDVLFPLDALWADPAVDFVGIDWYPPMGDWRDGQDHLDRQAGYAAPDEAAYLVSQIEGGEGYDWYYADQAARDAQVRTPIIDTAHGEHWVFRAKDMSGWANSYHHPRPGGARAAMPTSWLPGMKPIRLSEIGFAAVDKGGNAPNLFLDPKSTESGLPPYSSGARDAVFQRRALTAVLPYFENDPLVEETLVWAWDARPFPAWPLREDVWGDGGNWARGHWLNGRSGLAPLAGIVADVCRRGGVGTIDVRELDGLVPGFALEGVHSVRAALEPLRTAFGFEVVERAGVLVFRMPGVESLADVSPTALAGDGWIRTRRLVDKAPERLRIIYADAGRDDEPAIAEARTDGGDPRLVADVTLPLALDRPQAEDIARALLDAAANREAAEIALGPEGIALEPGDIIRLEGGADSRIESITDSGILRTLTLRQVDTGRSSTRSADPGSAPRPAMIYSRTDLVVMDAPALPGVRGGAGPLIAAFAEPWPAEVRVEAGDSAVGTSARAVLTRPATIGRLMLPVGPGPVGRWDRVTEIHLVAPGATFESVAPLALLAGANTALLETAFGWELIQFQRADLVGPDTWRLSGLLRGLRGSLSATADIGARLVIVDDALVRTDVQPEEIGGALVWRAGGDDPGTLVTYADLSGTEWTVAHLRLREGVARWTRRGRDVAESWALPEAPNEGRFAVEADFGGGVTARNVVDGPETSVPAGAVAIRVAGIGPDGRTGGWLSIATGSP